MYASLLISLLAAFIAMLGKQWLNRYLRHLGGSVIERCGDRQRKCDGLERWPFHLFVESLPIMLQIALFLLASGLCRYMASINTPVAGVLIGLTALGALFYIGIVIAGASSYDCPFQTPGSVALRSLRTKIGPRLTPSVLPIVTALHNLGEVIQRRISRIAMRFLHANIWHHSRSVLKKIQLRILGVGLRLHLLLPTTQENSDSATPQETDRWLTPKDLATIQRTSANDVRCISWILRSITDQDALDAAIRLAGTIRWFEEGTEIAPPYGLIVSTFTACFGSDRRVYPGSRDRAYYSGRAILWIHVLAMCKSEELARKFTLPTTRYTAPHRDHDLTHILDVSKAPSANDRFMLLADTYQGCTPSHLQWISNVLLHLAWANRTTLNVNFIRLWTWSTVPLDSPPNRLLAWCIFLGSDVEEEVLKVQDKSCEFTFFLLSGFLTLLFASDRLEQILHQLSGAIVPALNTAHPRCRLIPDVLQYLTWLEDRPRCLTEMAYEWCSVICENRQSLEDWESLVLYSLEIGFRHFDPEDWRISGNFTHTEHHRELVEVVFKRKESEAIADLLQAWTMRGIADNQGDALLGICAGHLVDLHSLTPLSPRLRRLVIRSIGFIRYKGFEEVGVGKFIDLVNHLHVDVEDVGTGFKWILILLDTIKSPEGARGLSIQSWELLVELATTTVWSPGLRERIPTYTSQVMAPLLKAREWDKLECWIGVVWMTWPLETDATMEDVEHAMILLFHQRPGAVQKLTQWMERWSKERSKEVPEAFKRICKRPPETAQLDAS